MTTTDQRTLEEALRETARAKWEGRRCYATNMSQATKALDALCAQVRLRSSRPRRDVRADHVTVADIRSLTAMWYSEGLAPATINKRLNCLSATGVSVEGCRVREPKVLKWWLKPEDEKRLGEYLVGLFTGGDLRAVHVSRFISWTTRTGLRVEETLRLRLPDFQREGHTFRALTVPGLKTAAAQATLPLGDGAARMVTGRFDCGDHDGRFIPLTYAELEEAWRGCRIFLGAENDPTATLKALRRSAARHLHITRGMPLDMVRQYLRHEDIETTIGYLRLTGGYGTEEMRRWL